ncbi:unnamed protein product [Leuciscus chuanchicus]
MESPGQQVNKGREEGECWERGGGGTGDALGLCVVSGGHGPLEDECAGGASQSMRSVIFRKLRLCCTITIHFLQKALRQRFAMSAPVRCF